MSIRHILKSMYFFSFLLLLSGLSLASHVTKVIGNSPVELHGFDIVHKHGWRGQGQWIAFIENGVSPNHPQFKENQVLIYDVSRKPTPIGKDCSSWRYKSQEKEKLNAFIYNDIEYKAERSHGNHVLGIAIGQAGYHRDKNCIYVFKGGCCPEAQALTLAISECLPNRDLWDNQFKIFGIGIFTLKDTYDTLKFLGYVENGEVVQLRQSYDNSFMTIPETDFFYQSAKKQRHQFQETYIKSLPMDALTHLENEKIDDSMLQAFSEFFKSKVRILNLSSILDRFYNPHTETFPEYIFDLIGDGLEKNDKIMILAAGNQGINISQSKRHAYFKYFAQHPKIKRRFLIGVNVDLVEQDPEGSSLGSLTLPNTSRTFLVVKGNRTNWPGDELKDFAICTVGNRILSGYGFPDGEKVPHSVAPIFAVKNGTSEATPIIASECALVFQKFPQMNGVEAIDLVKRTTIPFGNPEETGLGYLWAPYTLGQ